MLSIKKLIFIKKYDIIFIQNIKIIFCDSTNLKYFRENRLVNLSVVDDNEDIPLSSRN